MPYNSDDIFDRYDLEPRFPRRPIPFPFILLPFFFERRERDRRHEHDREHDRNHDRYNPYR